MLFIGDDWAEDHHDVEVQDEQGEGRGPRASDDDLGANPAHAAASGRAARVLPRDPGGLRHGRPVVDQPPTRSRPILGARVLAEFGDAPGRYCSSKDRKNYAGTSPTTRQSGSMQIVAARYIHNDRLVDALQGQASCAILHDPEVRSYYDQLRARGTKHNAALRQVANRLVGILHGCLNARTRYDRNTAWAHRHIVAA